MIRGALYYFDKMSGDPLFSSLHGVYEDGPFYIISCAITTVNGHEVNNVVSEMGLHLLPMDKAVYETYLLKFFAKLVAANAIKDDPKNPNCHMEFKYGLMKMKYDFPNYTFYTSLNLGNETANIDKWGTLMALQRHGNGTGSFAVFRDAVESREF